MFSESQTLLEATKFFELIVVLFYFIVEKVPFHSSENLFILLSHVNLGREHLMVSFILILN